MFFSKLLLVAEISANHNGSIITAKKLIKSAKINSADAVKLQTFDPLAMTLKSKKKYFKVKTGLWKNKFLFDLYKKAETPYSWHKELFDYAKKLNIKIFSSVFGEKDVDFLEELNCPVYKVSSFEMSDFGLIKRISETKKPIIISTGTASLEEIDATYEFVLKNGIKDVTLLYCVSNYPSQTKDFNLNNIQLMKKRYNCRIGFSDHSLNDLVAFAAVAAGADLVEKHIALNNQYKGLDIKFSIKGIDIKKFKEKIILAKKLRGSNQFKRSKNENQSKLFRRSIFITESIKKDEVFTKLNLKKIRPGHGVGAQYYERLIGKKSPFDLKKEQPLKEIVLKKLKIIKTTNI